MKIGNDKDVIDSWVIIERIDDLELRAEIDPEFPERTGLNEEEAKELAALIDLRDKASGFPDWWYGERLIRDSYFKDYAQDLAEETSAMQAESWPLNCMDWERAARELQMDYTSVDFDGVTYWIRTK